MLFTINHTTYPINPYTTITVNPYIRIVRFSRIPQPTLTTKDAHMIVSAVVDMFSKPSKIKQDVCPICLNDLADGNCVQLECSHQFHKSCVNRLVHQKHCILRLVHSHSLDVTCPNCRKPIISAELVHDLIENMLCNGTADEM